MRIVFGLFIVAGMGFAQNPISSTFPTSISTMPIVCNGARGVLTQALNNSPTSLTITVNDGSPFCYPSFVTIDREVVKICSKSGNVLTACSGGRAVHSAQTGGGIANHAIGASVVGYIDENYNNQAMAEIAALETFIGAGGANVLQPNKNITMSSDGTYDIGAASASRPRDAHIQRDLIAGNSGKFGSWKIDGTVQTYSGGSLLLDSTHNGKVIRTTSSAAVTVTVPTGLGVFSCMIIQDGTGSVTVVGAPGVTLKNPRTQFTTYGNGSPASIVCSSSDVCLLAGDLKP